MNNSAWIPYSEPHCDDSNCTSEAKYLRVINGRPAGVYCEVHATERDRDERIRNMVDSLWPIPKNEPGDYDPMLERGGEW